MADIFNRTLKNTKGGFKIDNAQLTFSGGAAQLTTGLLIQNVQIQYQQQVTFVYDLADPSGVYYVAGKAQGTLAMSKIVGSAAGMTQFYTDYGDACKTTNTISITGAGGTCTGTTTTGVKYDIVSPLIVSYGMTMAVNEGTIGENIQMQFAQLLMT